MSRHGTRSTVGARVSSPDRIGQARWLLPWLVFLAASGCTESILEPTLSLGENGTATLVGRSGGLVMTLELSDLSPKVGDTLRIRAGVANQGSPREVEYRICGLDIEGLPLTSDPVVCGGYSARASLKTGEAVWTDDPRVVQGPAGKYRLRVRHLLQPETWIQVHVVVLDS
jgi:hypothetical protein